MFFCHAAHAQAACFDVEVERGFANHLCQFTGGDAAHAVHLKQAVLGHGVAFEEDGVLPSGGCDVGNSASIAANFARRADRRGDVASDLGKWAIHL